MQTWEYGHLSYQPTAPRGLQWDFETPVSIQHGDTQSLVEVLDGLGQNGWEMVSALEDSGEGHVGGKRDVYYPHQFYFKRPKP
jgi:hypothetical protein